MLHIRNSQIETLTASSLTLYNTCFFKLVSHPAIGFFIYESLISDLKPSLPP